MNKKIGNATVWSSITELMAKIVGPIVNIVLARLLLPEAFGVVASINVVISFAEVFTDAGFQKYLIQHEFTDEDALDKSTNVAFWTNLSLSALACLVIFLFKDKIATLVGSPGLGMPISLASLLIVLQAFSSIQMARYKRDFDFKTLFFVRMGTSLLPLVVTIPLAVILRNYWALLIGNFASLTFRAVALTVKAKWKIKFYYNFALLKEMFSFTSWTLLESVSVWLTSYIDVFIVGSVLSSHYLGLYKTAMTTVNSYMGIVTASVLPVVFSALSRYQNDEKQFKQTFFTFQRLTAVLVIPMGVGIYLFRDTVTQILLGSQWMDAADFLGLWGLTGAITIVISHFSSEVYRSKGKPRISVLEQIIHLAFVIPTLLIAVKYGFEVLCLSRAAVRLQGLFVSFIVMRIVFGFQTKKILANIWPTVLSSLAMGMFGYLLKPIFSGIVWQFFVIFLCVVVYFAVLLTCFPKLRGELLATPYAKKVLRILKRK